MKNNLYLSNESLVMVHNMAKQLRHYYVGKISNDLSLMKSVNDNGVKLFFMSNQKCYSILMWNSKTNSPEIYIDENLSEKNQLVLFAKEFGHLVIDWKWNPYELFDGLNEDCVLNVNLKDEKKTNVKEVLISEFVHSFLNETIY